MSKLTTFNRGRKKGSRDKKKRIKRAVLTGMTFGAIGGVTSGLSQEGLKYTWKKLNSQRYLKPSLGKLGSTVAIGTVLGAIGEGIAQGTLEKYKQSKYYKKTNKRIKKMVDDSATNSNFSLVEFKTNKRDRKKQTIGAAQLGVGSYVGYRTIRSATPRLLGVRLESHNTTRDRAKQILANNGYLDPSKSGTGAITGLQNMLDEVEVKIRSGKGDQTFLQKRKEYLTQHINNAKGGKVYITGVHTDAKNSANPVINPLFDKKKPLVGNNPITNILYRPLQRSFYRGGVGYPKTIIGKAGAMISGALGIKGKSLYIGGSDDYFNQNFKPDFDDDRAMYAEKRIQVYKNRTTAIKEALKKEGNGSLVKGIGSLVRKNPSRVIGGLGILGIGGAATYVLGKQAIDNLTSGNVKSYKRKTKQGKTYSVKGYVRKKSNRKP